MHGTCIKIQKINKFMCPFPHPQFLWYLEYGIGINTEREKKSDGEKTG